ncbi:MAG: aspartate/glutamate racemase family protein [Clostridiaceae bacterium]|jgi:allantoin racemase|nr:aspartate/glutamate racemase family protein [Clostridiaceae bacterium]
MRLLYLVPGSTGPGFEESIIERRRDILQEMASAGTVIEAKASGTGPLSIESMYDEYAVIPGAIEAIIRAEKEGIDGVIMGCAGDPGVDGAREVVSIPVVGPAQASFAIASILGRRFSIVTPVDQTIGTSIDLAVKCGYRESLASVRSAGITVLDINKDPDIAAKRSLEAARKARDEDGADCIVLGCMSLAFAGFDKEASKELGIPVINPAMASLKVLETLVAMGISQSKRAYPMPTSMLRI